MALRVEYPPEFYREAPADWVARLAEVAPEMPNLDRLVFRYFSPVNPDGSDRGWNHSDQGQYVLYTAKPLRMVEAGRAEQFTKHWSELPSLSGGGLSGEQVSLKAVVSEYQFFMWHTKGLYVQPFLILQGPMGGTPAKYTEAETAFLQASACVADPFDIGTFPACPFDERTVKTIAMRDRLLGCDNDLAELARLDTPEHRKGETAAAQLLKRNTHLDTMAVILAPSVEFMKSYYRTKAAASLRPAPEGTTRAVAQWRDHWLQHGSVIGAGPAKQTKVQMAVQ